MFPEIPAKNIPTLNTDQMVEVDRTMEKTYRIEPIQMMENAGGALAHLARVRFCGGDPVGKRILALSGSGGNGGDALVAARRLSNWGSDVTVALGQVPEKMSDLAGHQLDSLQRMEMPGSQEIADIDNLKGQEFDLILDGLIGFSLKGAPYGMVGELITYANDSGVPILSVDAPSGVDTTTGTIFDPAIKARATITLAMPKDGLFAEGVAEQTGELYLADISVPPALYKTFSLPTEVGPIFAKGDIVRIV